MDLYSEIILDYFKNPRNKGPLEDATSSATELNPLCGDKITVHLKANKEGKIEKISYEGEGCAISQAAISMLTEILAGKTIQETKEIDNQVVYDMLGVQISPGRVKCALLGLVTAKKAAILNQYKDA